MNSNDVQRNFASTLTKKGLGRRAVLVEQGGAMQLKVDWLAEEVPVELRCIGNAFAVMMVALTCFVARHVFLTNASKRGVPCSFAS